MQKIPIILKENPKFLLLYWSAYMCQQDQDAKDMQKTCKMIFFENILDNLISTFAFGSSFINCWVLAISDSIFFSNKQAINLVYENKKLVSLSHEPLNWLEIVYLHHFSLAFCLL